jgi:HK97 family phage portal protein
MNKLQKFVSAIKGTVGTIDDYFLRNISGRNLKDNQILEDPYTNVSLVYTCISTTARAIAQVPLMVVEYDKRGNPIPVDHNHPWQKLLDRPNYMMNRTAFVEAVLSYWLLDGNCCIIPFPPGYGETPQSMWPVRWKYMEYTTDERTGHVKKWIYAPNNNLKVELKPEDVLHLRFWNPNDPIEGLAPSRAGSLPILSLQRAQNYNFQFFENGAVASGILHTDKQLSRNTFERTKAQVNEEYGVKQQQAHKIMVLEQGLKWAATGVTHRDMEFPALHHLNAEEILQIYGMKKSIISITADLNFATAQSERKEWWHGTCLPLMNFIEETLAFGFFGTRGIDLDILFDISSIAALHEAFADKVKTADVLLRLGFTRNEVNKRLELGFPNVKWGDAAYMPVNMMPVNDAGKALIPSDGEPNPNNPANPQNPNEPGQNNPPDEPKPPKEGDDKPKPKPKPSKSVRSETLEEYYNNLWISSMHQLNPVEEKVKSKVERVFFEMRRNVLSRLNGRVDNIEAHNFDAEKMAISRYLSALLTEAVKVGLTTFDQQYDPKEGVTYDQDPIVVNYLVGRDILLRNIIENAKKSLVEKLRDVEKDNPHKLEEAAKGVFNQLTSRAKTIARTETMNAFNFARNERISRSNYAQKEWYSHNHSERHEPMDGKRVGVQESWLLPDGTWVKFPGDMSGGASNTVNCQCMEFIVVGGY